MQNDLNDSRVAFPNRIRALIVDSDARFLRSASLMLSLLNFLVATCETPVLAVKLLRERLKDADVVFIDALRATTCGFDFRGIVQSLLCIPVIYYFSFDYMVAGEVAEALRCNVWAATYVIKKPLDAADFYGLWRVIGGSKFLLRRGGNTLSWTEWPRGNRAFPAAVQELFPSSSTFEVQGDDDDDSDLYKVVRAGRGQRRKLGDSCGGGSSGRGRGRGRSGLAGGHPTRRLERMNVTEGHESDDDDDVPSYQLPVPVLPAQQNQLGVQVQVTDVQNRHHGRSLFMQPVLRMLNLSHNNPMIFAEAAGPSSSNVTAFAGPSNTSSPALLQLPVYRAPAPATSPARHADSAQATTPGLPPLVYQQPQQQPAAAARAKRGRPRRELVDSHDGGSNGRGVAVGQPTRRQEHMNMTEGQENDDDDMIPSQQQRAQQNRRGFQAMDVQNEQHILFMQRVSQMLNVPRHNLFMSADAAGPSSSNNATTFAGASNIYTPAQPLAPVLPPVHQQQQPCLALNVFGNMVAPPAAAVLTMAATTGHQPQFTPNQQRRQDMSFVPRRQCSWMGRRRDTGPIMLSFQQPPVADPFTPMAGGDQTFGASTAGATDSASLMAPQDLMVPTGKNQVESPGPSAIMFNGNSEMAAMFPSDQDDENAILSLDALWDFDDNVPVYPEGQQVAEADRTSAANATGTMSNDEESGGLGPNWNMGAADDCLDMLEEYLKDGNASDFLLPQDMNNNGHQ